MAAWSKLLFCDGCGLPASPEHIAERLRRLERSTKFRPVHVGVLFVALAPPLRPEDDFYGPPDSREFFDPFLDALEIPASTAKAAAESDAPLVDATRLAEFQRKGCYLAYLSECPLSEKGELAAAIVSRLGPTLLRRIQFNYKPKHIAPLGPELALLIDLLRSVGIGPTLILNQGTGFSVPRAGNREASEQLRNAMISLVSRENPPSEYDRIRFTQTEGNIGAGGSS